MLAAGHCAISGSVALSVCRYCEILRMLGSPPETFCMNGTELICVVGHGLLHVPEIPTRWFSTQRWLYLDPVTDVTLSPEIHVARVLSAVRFYTEIKDFWP
jgi:hypothetical protein